MSEERLVVHGQCPPSRSEDQLDSHRASAYLALWCYPRHGLTGQIRAEEGWSPGNEEGLMQLPQKRYDETSRRSWQGSRLCGYLRCTSVLVEKEAHLARLQCRIVLKNDLRHGPTCLAHGKWIRKSLEMLTATQ